MSDFLEDFHREPGGKPAPDADPRIQRERWGIFPDVDIAQYHAGLIPEVSLSNSGMKRLLAETPLDFAFHNVQLNPDGKEEKILETVAARRGDVVHQLTLGKGKGFAVGDFKDWRTNDAKSFKERAVADGLVPIKRVDFEEAQVISEVLLERIREFLDGAHYETECAFLYQEETSFGPIWVRGLMDIWCPEHNLIVDPKVTAMLYDESVGRQLYNMGWDRQAALYQRGMGQITGKGGHIRFVDLMVKPEAPFTSRLVALEKADEYQAVKECQEAMERFAKCFYSGEWPGFPDRVERVPLPEWVRRKREKAETGEA
jgi:hypothetical protein